MRRRALVAVIASSLALAAVLGMRLSSRTTAETDEQPAPAPAAAAALPISQVVLFSSGVGYFQREGEVQGDARVDLTFPVQDINDLLKSMVLEDQGGGHISAVNYDSQAPIERTLRSFAINLTGNPSFAQILNQARGEKVDVSTAGARILAGVVMGVERKQEVHGKETSAAEFVNLWCAEGMRSVKLSDVQNVRFLNPVLDGEVNKALEVLAPPTTRRRRPSASTAWARASAP